MNKELLEIVHDRLATFEELKKEHRCLIEEMLAHYIADRYRAHFRLPTPLDLTACATLEYFLATALVSLMRSIGEYTAVLDGPRGASPTVYLSAGYRLIDEGIRKQCEDVVSSEREKNRMKVEPNWPYPCRHCKKKTVFMDSYCGRGTDEAMILTFTCLDCKKSWT